MNKYNIVFLLVATLLFACEKPEENISAPRFGLTNIYAQFADESISTEQFTTSQEAPFGEVIRIQFPKYYPRNTLNPIDITRMRMTATLPVNVKIEPKLNVMDLTKPNTIEVINSNGTVDKHVIIGEIVE
ncbi:DUF5018 domain-containing protein [Parapedobacter sp. SGR-10]|uniref:DUF5018 domain-containing protein n=1 Tax=Parapedobacter sp. SGR-10 TaxID=2710879 RepID=UPI0013D7FB64|nr:DUF5018 domain-containing protein [Parapedobacter sp. SGR-10]NGF56418.1 DUF5018 domain-containing protein [Parapedobacter sp. SGR-10]